MPKCTTVAIAGCGSRGYGAYSIHAKQMPDRMKIVAAADLIPERLERMAKEYDLPREMCFSSAEEMLKQDKLADVLFVCVQDRDHVRLAVEGIKKGYDILLEKPISPDLYECAQIVKVAKEYHKAVTVCHVLRYTPFYQKIKDLIDAGVIGEVANITAVESVGYWHQAHSFVRGNWRNSKETSPMILAKSCHDMDILLWLSGKKCKSVSSFGNTFLFRADKAPEGAALRCLDGCKCKESCPYDAEKIYLDNKATGFRQGNSQWPCDVLSMNPTEESLLQAIQEGPYGRCVYHCDNDVVDHQVVNMEMEDHSTISFTMCAFGQKVHRTIRVMGTMGQIEGDTEDFIIRCTPFGGETQVIDINALAKDTSLSGHGGGDAQLIRELFDQAQNPDAAKEPLTSVERSVESHFVALAAERSRLHDGVSIQMDNFVREFTE